MHGWADDSTHAPCGCCPLLALGTHSSRVTSLVTEADSQIRITACLLGQVLRTWHACAPPKALLLRPTQPRAGIGYTLRCRSRTSQSANVVTEKGLCMSAVHGVTNTGVIGRRRKATGPVAFWPQGRAPLMPAGGTGQDGTPAPPASAQCSPGQQCGPCISVFLLCAHQSPSKSKTAARRRHGRAGQGNRQQDAGVWFPAPG